MRINNPRITKELLINKILHSSWMDISGYIKEYVVELGYENIEGDYRNVKWICKLKENITQQEIIELYYKLNK
jgi:hypothetical protein